MRTCPVSPRTAGRQGFERFLILTAVLKMSTVLSRGRQPHGGSDTLPALMRLWWAVFTTFCNRGPSPLPFIHLNFPNALRGRIGCRCNQRAALFGWFVGRNATRFRGIMPPKSQYTAFFDRVDSLLHSFLGHKIRLANTSAEIPFRLFRRANRSSKERVRDCDNANEPEILGLSIRHCAAKTATLGG